MEGDSDKQVLRDANLAMSEYSAYAGKASSGTNRSLEGPNAAGTADAPAHIPYYRPDPWVLTSGSAHSSLNWHERVYHFMHSRRVHVVLMVLLGIDVLISIASIILEIEYLKSETDDYEHIVEVCQEALSTSDPAAVTYCLYPGDVGNGSLAGAQEVLGVLSLIILFIFLSESLILLASNPISFFSSPMYSIDLIVVVVSLFLEFYLKGGAEGGILTVERFWRFARISHGVYDESKPDLHASRFLHALEEIRRRHKGLEAMAELSPRSEGFNVAAVPGSNGSSGTSISSTSKEAAVAVIDKVGAEAAAEIVATVAWYLEKKKAEEE